MNNIKKFLTVCIVVVLVALSFYTKGVLFSKADSNDNTKKYERDNHLAVNEYGELNITRNHLGDTPMGKEDSWTIFVYLCGSDLESGVGAATTDIREMIDANYSENVNIIIQTGGSTEWKEYGIKSDKIQRYRVLEDSLELLEELPNASMAESKTLEEFITWGIDNYATEHMGMIYWNHGGGSIYGACSDKNYKGMLTLSEFEKALSYGTKKMTDKFEFIGFDACLMASIETANTFVSYADYFIASEESESGEGWSYTDIVNKMVENPDVDVITLGKTIIDSFMQSNMDLGTVDLATLSMTDLSKIDPILTEFNKVAKKMYESCNTTEDITIYTRLAYAAENYAEGSGFDMIDFTDYMLNIADLVPEANDVVDLLKDAIIYERHGEGFKDTVGLTFYYCYGNMNLSDMNILRNICISPYLLNFIEKIAYGKLHHSSLDGFESNNWHTSEYYYDEDYRFVDYEFQKDNEYVEGLKDADYFKNASFDDVWSKWFGVTTTDVEKINSSLADKICINDNILRNELSDKDRSNIAKASYKIVENNGQSMDVVGDLGDISREVVLDNKWFSFSNGSLINATKINEGNGLTMYKAPVLIDNNESFIIFVTDKKDEVMILGTWSGMDKNDKSAGRYMAGIKEGVNIAPIYKNVNYSTGVVNEKYGENVKVRRNLIKKISLDNCSYVVEVIDGFGNVSYSNDIKANDIKDNVLK